MLDDAPSKKIRHRDLTIEGYSRAAVQTCWRVNELKVLFEEIAKIISTKS